eukprot:TRINITY_DN17928_c0_g1_i2.p1 TRINITY_DN17928_c0_g1~~TRINITY_DN17928_c0_g1_i2.p1  ORF type:complete len:246 (-),score=59.07 TRINITY_DN17928_c0_g1_i2:6-743(-)
MHTVGLVGVSATSGLVLLQGLYMHLNYPPVRAEDQDAQESEETAVNAAAAQHVHLLLFGCVLLALVDAVQAGDRRAALGLVAALGVVRGWLWPHELLVWLFRVALAGDACLVLIMRGVDQASLDWHCLFCVGHAMVGMWLLRTAADHAIEALYMVSMACVALPLSPDLLWKLLCMLVALAVSSGFVHRDEDSLLAARLPAVCCGGMSESVGSAEGRAHTGTQPTHTATHTGGCLLYTSPEPTRPY